MMPVQLRVRELRKAKGLTGAELARQAKVRPSTLSAIENNQTTGIAFDVLDRIATALGVDAAMLVVHTGRKAKVTA
jgi:transcriptional regulator with XRE-family HTH domain